MSTTIDHTAADNNALLKVMHRELIESEHTAAAPGDRAALVVNLVRSHAPLSSPQQQAALADQLRSRVEGLGPLDVVLADTAVTDVMVHGDGDVWVERGGALTKEPLHIGADLLGVLIERILAPLGRRVDQSSPIVDARLADGSRVHVVVPPVAVDGPCLTIRRFREGGFTADSFAAPHVVAVLRTVVRSGANVLISGGTGAGKTSLLNALAGFLPPSARVVTIEDTAELVLAAPHVVRLETRPRNAEGAGGIDARELVRAALRMRPDRIVVGEIRGAEALDMLQAMNTGHAGSLSTVHANTSQDALRRLETLSLFGENPLPLGAVRSQILAAIDVVVQVRRLSSGERAVVAVDELVDFSDRWKLRSIRDGELHHRGPRLDGGC